MARAAEVRENGWESYHGIWSTGEVVGVVVVLADRAELAALGETEQSALERWAYDLWGLARGQADVVNACEDTRQWFEVVAYEVANGDAVRELLRRAAESATVRKNRPRRVSDSDGKDGAR